MQINVAQLLKGTVGLTKDYEASGCIDVTGNGAEGEVRGEVRLTRTDRAILVKGTLRTKVEVACGRCLALFSCPLVLNIEEEYFPTIDVNTGASMFVPDEPGCFTIDEQHVLDLTEAVRQYALLAVPMKPLCDDGCAGLCPDCGRNLNLGLCDCPSQPVDPRWAVLTRLTSEQKGIG